jgi:two-component system response regulator (stage 0 sporulation protein F)
MKRILVADDDESIQMLYVEEFTEEGYEVITCGDGSQIVDLIGQKRPDLIVMDIRLGNYNGLDLLQDIRNSDFNQPIIFCTAYPTLKCDLNSIAADSFVVKSSDLKELKIAIKKFAEGRISSPRKSTGTEVRRNEPMRIEQLGVQS